MSNELKRWKRSQLEYMHPEHEVVDAKSYDALLAERDAYKKALEKLARVPGCGCSFPCRCGGEEWTRAELEGRMDYAAETLTRAALQGAQP